MRQHAKPVYVSGDRSVALERVAASSRDFDEEWIQKLIHEHPQLLPIQEIEPVFSDAVPLCMELSTSSGFVDNVLINESGFITLVECKLFRNPEARRKVVAQVLDYAKDLAAWTFVEFEKAICRARSTGEDSLVDIMRESFPDIDEAEFVDGVTTSLKEARFLLLIAGDGIRENAEDLLNFINRFGSLRFVISFVELPVYQIRGAEEYLVTPRILAKTTELVRSVSSFVGSSQTAAAPADVNEERPSRTLSEDVFYERLSETIGRSATDSLRAFIQDLRVELGIVTNPGRGKTLSLNLKSPDNRYNFGSILENGLLYFYGIVFKTGEIGDRSIGVDYLSEMAGLIDGELDDSYEEWSWRVKKNRKYPMVTEYLDKLDEWKSLIRKTLDRIQRLESE